MSVAVAWTITGQPQDPRPARAEKRARTHDGHAPADLADAFEGEALPHLGALYGAACRLAGNRYDAEDLVQETCLRAYRSFHLYARGTDVRAWLFTILYRVRADAFRRAGRSPRTVTLAVERACPQPGPEARLCAGDELERALSRLPECFRATLLLRDLEGFTYDEIATMLAVPVGTVMSRLHRARAALREALASARAPEAASAR